MNPKIYLKCEHRAISRDSENKNESTYRISCQIYEENSLTPDFEISLKNLLGLSGENLNRSPLYYENRNLYYIHKEKKLRFFLYQTKGIGDLYIIETFNDAPELMFNYLIMESQYISNVFKPSR